MLNDLHALMSYSTESFRILTAIVMTVCHI